MVRRVGMVWCVNAARRQNLNTAIVNILFVQGMAGQRDAWLPCPHQYSFCNCSICPGYGWAGGQRDAGLPRSQNRSARQFWPAGSRASPLPTLANQLIKRHSITITIIPTWNSGSPLSLSFLSSSQLLLRIKAIWTVQFTSQLMLRLNIVVNLGGPSSRN